MLLSVMVLILSFIGRVAYMAITSGPQQEGEILAQLPVGPEGGEEEFGDGGKIKVPEGALRERQTLTVRRSMIQDRIRALSPFGGTPIIIPAGTQIVFLFGPTNIRFLRPVTIVLPAPPPPAQGLVFLSANGQIRFLDGRDSGSRIIIQVNSFDFTRTSTFVNQSG